MVNIWLDTNRMVLMKYIGIFENFLVDSSMTTGMMGKVANPKTDMNMTNSMVSWLIMLTRQENMAMMLINIPYGKVDVLITRVVFELHESK